MTAGPTIAHVSDLHLGAHSDAAAEQLVADVGAAAPTLTVVTGDLTMRARPDQFRRAAALIGALPAPRMVVPGNHDLPLGNPILRLLRPYERYRRYLGADLDSWLDVPGLRIYGLASMPRWRWKSGRVSRRQCADLVGVLRDAPPGAVRALALHHPVEPVDPLGLLGGRRLRRALGQARVGLVLAGHTHLPSTRPIDLRPAGAGRLVEVVAGTATSTRTRGGCRSWALIRLAGDTLTVEHRRLDGRSGPGALDMRTFTLAG